MPFEERKKEQRENVIENEGRKESKVKRREKCNNLILRRQKETRKRNQRKWLKRMGNWNRLNREKV